MAEKNTGDMTSDIAGADILNMIKQKIKSRPLSTEEVEKISMTMPNGEAKGKLSITNKLRTFGAFGLQGTPFLIGQVTVDGSTLIVEMWSTTANVPFRVFMSDNYNVNGGLSMFKLRRAFEERFGGCPDVEWMKVVLPGRKGFIRLFMDGNTYRIESIEFEG